MQQSATDPTTGTIDMDCINIGVSSSDRRARDQLSNEVLALLKCKLIPTSNQHCGALSTALEIILQRVFQRVFAMLDLSKIAKTSHKTMCHLQNAVNKVFLCLQLQGRL